MLAGIGSDASLSNNAQWGTTSKEREKSSEFIWTKALSAHKNVVSWSKLMRAPVVEPVGLNANWSDMLSASGEWHYKHWIDVRPNQNLLNIVDNIGKIEMGQ